METNVWNLLKILYLMIQRNSLTIQFESVKDVLKKHILWSLLDISNHWYIRMHWLFHFRLSLWNIFRCNNWNSAIDSSIWALANLLGIIFYGCDCRKLSSCNYSSFIWIFPKYCGYVYKTCPFKPLCGCTSVNFTDRIFIRAFGLWNCGFYCRTIDFGNNLCCFDTYRKEYLLGDG